MPSPNSHGCDKGNRLRGFLSVPHGMRSAWRVDMLNKGVNSIMIIGEKESFLTRTLIKKLSDAGYEAKFVKAEVDAIAAAWGSTDAYAYYIESLETMKRVVFHFIHDKLAETDKRIYIIGEKEALDKAKEYIQPVFIEKTYLRPLQTEEFINDLAKYSGSRVETEAKPVILIVDDDTMYLGVIRDWLRGTYRVHMVNSGLQAIKWLGANKADLILLDYEMPVTSGPQVLEMLRSEPETASIPVFFLTGKGDRESVMQVMSLKPQNYLLKTIDREKLLAVMRDFFANRK